MMKKLFLGLLVCTSLTTFAQSGNSDPAAKKILDEVSAKFKSHKSVSATFTLKTENSSGKQEAIQSGNVYMKGNKYRVDMGDQQIYSDGKIIWTLEKSDKEVQVTHFDPTSNMLTPQKMFTNFYDKDFLYKLNGESKRGSKVIQEIELTPTDKTELFFKVLLEVDKATKNIAATKVFEKNGNRYIYTITDYKTNTPLAESLFVFDAKAHPGVEVIDLR